ncbi:MAG TPA: hypothetical protein VFG04_02240 [Planctomycetaceae bacterium]|jgi:hypothetical protein|nr:hypothetical protein [Planctomycetaceae bacterium]
MPDTQQIPKSVSRAVRVSTFGCAAWAVVYFVVLGNSGTARVPSRIRPALPPPSIKEARQPTPWITISKERTRVTQPVKEDGYIDYLAALNAMASEGATPDNNAAVLLVRAMDLSSEEPDRQHFYKMLGVDPPRQVESLFPENSAFLTNQGDRFADTLASMVPWSPEEFAPRARWLRNHEQALELAVEATRRSHCYFPLVRPADAKMLFEVPLPGLQASNEIAKALTARALLRIHEGKPLEARQDLLACHRLARLVGNGPFLIHGALGRAIEIKTSIADMALLDPGQLSGADALAYRAELRKLPPLATVAQQLDQGERLLFLGFFTELAQKQQPELEEMVVSLAPLVSPDYLMQLLTDQMTVIWDEGLRVANQDWDRWVAAVRTPITSGRQKQLDLLESKARPLLKDKPEAHSDDPLEEKGQWMGRVTAARMLPRLKPDVLIEDRARMRADLVQLGLALTAYRADVGSYPATLDALIPKYCSEVPLDRFTAKPLRYVPRADGYLLYSVGDNAVDDGGRTSDAQPPGDDIVLDIPRKIPAPKPSRPLYDLTGNLMGFACACLSLATLGGLITTLVRVCGLRRLSTWIALTHGLIATLGLLILIFAAATKPVPPAGFVSLGLLVIATAGGVWMYVAFHRRQKRLPILLVLGHGTVAICGVALLWLALYRLELFVRTLPMATLHKTDARISCLQNSPRLSVHEEVSVVMALPGWNNG